MEVIEIIGNDIVRIYGVEEYETHFNSKKYVSVNDLVNVNLMQFLMQRQREIVTKYKTRIKVARNKSTKSVDL